jgi:hypothetical protein
VSVIESTNSVVSGRPYNSVEFTLGGGGTDIDGESTFGADFTLSINPIKSLPSVWTGVAQSVYWEPKAAGSTDIYVDWSQDIWNDTLYFNVGWSVGALYGADTSVNWRTGPELSFQFYTHDNAFIYVGANYDVWTLKGDGEIRYSFGVGILF